MFDPVADYQGSRQNEFNVPASGRECRQYSGERFTVKLFTRWFFLTSMSQRSLADRLHEKARSGRVLLPRSGERESDGELLSSVFPTLTCYRLSASRLDALNTARLLIDVQIPRHSSSCTATLTPPPPPPPPLFQVTKMHFHYKPVTIFLSTRLSSTVNTSLSHHAIIQRAKVFNGVCFDQLQTRFYFHEVRSCHNRYCVFV